MLHLEIRSKRQVNFDFDLTNCTINEYASASNRIKDRSAARQDEASGDGFIDGKLSKQILNQAKSQMMELEQELSGGVIKKRLTAPSKLECVLDPIL